MAQPVVTLIGGTGFIGQALVGEFLDEFSEFPLKELRIFGRIPRNIPDHPAVKFLKGNILSDDDIRKAVHKSDIVYHMAAVVDLGGMPEHEVLELNTQRSRRIAELCDEEQVPYLIFTSSLDAVFSGKRVDMGNEDISYPSKFHNAYCKSKALAEQALLSSKRKTTSVSIIRPAAVWGENDPYFLPALIKMARSGLYIRMGRKSTRNMLVYVGNTAWSHFLLGKSLWEGNTTPKEKIYFSTDTSPSNMMMYFDPLLEELGYPPRLGKISIPFFLAWYLALLTELGCFLISPIKKITPSFSRFAVKHTSTTFTFSGERSLRDFGYTPKYSQQEALKKTAAFFKRDSPA